MTTALTSAGFRLEDLGELPPSSWLDLYAAVQSREYERLASMVAVVHPEKPAQVQAGFRRAARDVWGSEETKPIWADPARFKQMLTGAGVVAKPAEAADLPEATPEPKGP